MPYKLTIKPWRCVVAAHRLILFSTVPLTHGPQLLSLIPIHWWSPSPEFRAVSPAGGRARPNRRSFHTATHVSREFCRSYSPFFSAHIFDLDECVDAGWCAVPASAESFSTLRLCSTSSCARVARQQRARPLWRRPASATDWLHEDPVAQERTQLECGVMK